jgi:hypothetical protein
LQSLFSLVLFHHQPFFFPNKKKKKKITHHHHHHHHREEIDDQKVFETIGKKKRVDGQNVSKPQEPSVNQHNRPDKDQYLFHSFCLVCVFFLLLQGRRLDSADKGLEGTGRG